MLEKYDGCDIHLVVPVTLGGRTSYFETAPIAIYRARMEPGIRVIMLLGMVPYNSAPESLDPVMYQAGVYEIPEEFDGMIPLDLDGEQISMSDKLRRMPWNEVVEFMNTLAEAEEE